MTSRLAGPLSLAALSMLLVTMPADAQSRRRSTTDAESAVVERLNNESLQRARQNLDSPTAGPDTTSNLNRQSEDATRRGQNMDRAPQPFR